MKRTAWLLMQIALVWAAFGLFTVAHAEILVGDFATADASSTTWRRPADAELVRRLRGSDIAVVPVSELLPTDRVLSCEDPKVLPDSATPCTTRQPDTRDNWRLVAVVFPAPPGKSTDIRIRWKAPADTTDLIGYRLLLRLQRCDLSVPPCVAASYEPAVDVGLVDSYSTTVPGEMHEVCVQILPRAEDREGEAVEACSRRPLGALTDVAVEFTSR
jgi:hypothetical protein